MQIANKIINSSRLRCEIIDESNKDYVFYLYGRPENIELVQGIDAKQDIALGIECSKKYNGIGAYLFFEKSSNKFVGFGGIQKQERMEDGTLAMNEDIEFLILLDHEQKAKGYALEFCEAFFEKLFENFPNLEVPARTNKENLSCIKLLQKIGFREVGEVDYHRYGNKFMLLKNNLDFWQKSKVDLR